MVSENTSDIDALKQIYNYVVNNLSYDYDKAETVETGYLPDVDETLSTKTGICFDYAALTTAMLRSCDIPCKLQIDIPEILNMPGSMSTSVPKAG